MLEVNNGWVITDNTWLWKADHCVHSSGQRLEGEDSFMNLQMSSVKCIDFNVIELCLGENDPVRQDLPQFIAVDNTNLDCR